MKFRLRIWFITLIYALFGVLWILFSDWIAAKLFPSVVILQTVKGLFYVAITAVLIFLLIRGALGKLRQSEKKYRKLFDLSPDIIVLITPGGDIVDVNLRGGEVYGYSREEIRGRSLFDLTVPEFLDETSRFINGPGGENLVFESIHMKKDGNVFSVEMCISSVLIDGDERILCIIRDISERKEVENRLKRTIGEKESLVHELHHRTRNNMQIISALINLKVKSSSDGLLSETLLDMNHRIFSMSQVHYLLHKEGSLSRLNLTEYIHDVAVRLFQELKRGGKEIELNITKDDIFVLIDTAVPCGLICNELISNALKHAFTDMRTGTIDVGIVREDSEVEITVRDNGKGIPVEVDPDKAETLGFQIIHNLAEDQLRGSVHFDTRGGTRAVIRFSDTLYLERV